MPSDAKKKRDARKKEVAKAKETGKVADLGTAKIGNGVTNGDAESSASSVAGSDVAQNGTMSRVSTCDSELSKRFSEVEIENSKHRSCSGVLASHPRSRDLKVHQFTLLFHGQEIMADAQLEFNTGRRYGLVGLNGSGKSCLLQALANREVPIPEHMDLFMVSREIEAISKSALEAVMDADQLKLELEAEAEELAGFADDDSQQKLMDIYERLDDLGADLAESKAAAILHGLGFSKSMQQKECKDFSGGWRMRIALARALYLKPCILLLDEPTNHLDLDACVWLEEELKEYSRILVVVSHSQDFMNGVCTNIMHLTQKKLLYYTGNYDAFVKTQEELEENQMKKYNWEQAQLNNMKDYVARFGHGSAKLARQAQSKEKTMAKMVAGGLTEKVQTEKVKQFYFFEPGYIPPPVIMVQHVSFRYKDDTPLIYKDLDFGVDFDTRVALVGPNGAGKSTLLKLLAGEIFPSDGLIRRHSHVKLGRYHQHLAEQLDLELSALEYMMHEYPEVSDKEKMRSIVGQYGLTGRQQVCPMKQLSDGQRCRVSFAWLAWQQPHLLLLDEPTNHLDMESIDALAEAINAFAGGLILVSHDFRLVKQVVSEVWVCDHQKITKWPGDIFSYKEYLRRGIDKERSKIKN